MGILVEKCDKNCQEGQRICKSCLMILLGFDEISLHCENLGIVFIIFAELWVAFFHFCAELWVQNLNQNVTFPSKLKFS